MCPIWCCVDGDAFSRFNQSYYTQQSTQAVCGRTRRVGAGVAKELGERPNNQVPQSWKGQEREPKVELTKVKKSEPRTHTVPNALEQGNSLLRLICDTLR